MEDEQNKKLLAQRRAAVKMEILKNYPNCKTRDSKIELAAKLKLDLYQLYNIANRIGATGPKAQDYYRALLLENERTSPVEKAKANKDRNPLKKKCR